MKRALDVIVYSAVSDELAPIIRMSLHPILDSEKMGVGPKFGCRVVWDCLGSMPADFFVSCRGKDFVARTGCGWMPVPEEGFYASEADAIQWLLEGEEEP